MADEAADGCAVGLLVDLSPILPRKTVSMVTSLQSKKETGQCLLDDELFDFDLPSSPQFKFSALSAQQAVELFEQANSVAVQLQTAAAELRRAESRDRHGHADNPNETLDDIECPELQPVDDVEITLSSTPAPPAVVASANVAKPSRRSVSSVHGSQMRTKPSASPAPGLNRRLSSSATKENRVPVGPPPGARNMKPSSSLKVNQFMVQKSQQKNSSLTDTSISSASSASSVNVASRSRLNLTSTSANSSTGPISASSRLSRAKSVTLATKPPPVVRRTRPSIGGCQNSMSENPPVSQASVPLKRRPSVGGLSKPPGSEKVPLVSSKVTSTTKQPSIKPPLLPKRPTLDPKFGRKK